MKIKLVIISIVLVSIASLGATKFIKADDKGPKATQLSSHSAPIGGLVAEDK